MIRFCATAGGQIALVVAAGLMNSGATANAAMPSYWQGSDFSSDRANYDRDSDRPARRRIARLPRMPKTEAAKAEKLAQSVGKPTGPLVIAVSIANQTMKVYDINGLFAESPISSGMKGHSTPMGVFSVIQKNKFHRSNIYSGAPMPYMQRITWSGVAMHAGALPGYPASHGCIRLPMAFATKMWGWTRMGARVVITPGEISPATFAHPLLASLKSAPTVPATPMASAIPDQPSLKIADALPASHMKTADASNSMAPAIVTDVPPSAAAMMNAKAEEPAIVVAEAPTETIGSADTSAVVETPTKTEPQIVIETPVIAETLILAASPAASTKPSEEALPTLPATLEKPAIVEAAPAPAPKRDGGPIAIFVSRKDARLYVRQNFAPLFDVPITISGDQPLGTHVFTAIADKDASKPVQWTALSLPAPTRSDEPALSRRRQAAGAIAMTTPIIEASAAEALSRLKLPDDLAARLGDQLSNGSSLIVADQGITASGETGKGTDFIIRYR